MLDGTRDLGLLLEEPPTVDEQIVEVQRVVSLLLRLVLLPDVGSVDASLSSGNVDDQVVLVAVLPNGEAARLEPSDLVNDDLGFVLLPVLKRHHLCNSCSPSTRRVERKGLTSLEHPQTGISVRDHKVVLQPHQPAVASQVPHTHRMERPHHEL